MIVAKPLKVIALAFILSICFAERCSCKHSNGQQVDGQQCLSKPAWENIIDQLTVRLEKSPNNVEAHLKRGNAYKNIRLLNEALEDFNTAIRLKPDYADAYFLRGNTYVALQRNSLAMKDYSRVIELDPQYGDAYHNRSFIYDSLGQKDLAANDMAKSREILQSKKKE